MPLYMAMGMSPDEFWHGDVRAFKAYRKANKLRRRLADEDDWRLGFYVCKALIATNAWVKDRPQYPSEPMGFYEDEDLEAIERERRKRENMQRLEEFKKRFRKRHQAAENQ